MSLCFFFQAKDGIRDQPRSRGLGDVYKVQGEGCASHLHHSHSSAQVLNQLVCSAERSEA